MNHIPILIMILMTACSTGAPPSGAAVRSSPPVTISIIPEFYAGRTPVVRVNLTGDQFFTRPVSSVLSAVEIKGAGATILLEPMNVVPEETYRGFETQTFRLPNGLADGVYTATVKLTDWGVAVGPGSAEVTALKDLVFTTEFTYSPNYFEFESIAACDDGQESHLTLSFGERISPLSPSTFLERVRVVASGLPVNCKVNPRSITPENLVTGMPVELDCDRFAPPFSVILNGLVSQTGRTAAIFAPEQKSVGEVPFSAPTSTADLCSIYSTRIIK